MAYTITPWSKATETVANGGKTLTNIYNKCTLAHTSRTTTAYTNNFNWSVTSDFTLMFNVAIDNTDGITWTIRVQGSGDGTNYANLQSFTSVAADAAVAMMVYDYDTYGRCPYMRLEMIPSADVNGVADAIIIGIIPH